MGTDLRIRRLPRLIVAMLTLGVITTTSLAGATEADPERVRNPDNKHSYQRIDTPMRWQAAQKYCESRGGHLATIGSASENAFVYRVARSTWLGGTAHGDADGDNATRWRWVTGEPWTYTNWAPGEPDATSDDPDNGASDDPGTGASDSGRDSAGDARRGGYLHVTSGPGGTWNDLPDGDSPFVCEWEPPNIYVALGDSFSSGEGNPPFDGGSDTSGTACHRSPRAWPRLVKWHESDGYVRLVACSGAPLLALSEPYAMQQPQLQQLADTLPQVAGSKSLITITIGGNDLRFGAILAGCFLGDCAEQVQATESRIDRVNGLVGALEQAYRSIRSIAPRARLVVVGYPNIVPPPSSATVDCPWLDAGEQAAMAHLATALDSGVRTAASRAGVEYVSTLEVLAGHELCTGDSWMYPIGMSGGDNRGHPTALGQRAIAAVVQARIDQAS